MLNISPEIPSQHAEGIEALYDQTFGPGHFAKTAERLREHNQSLPELNRVAVQPDGDVVAVVRMWPIWIDVGGAALFVGPVAVHPRYRGQKLGLKLCKMSLDAARVSGWHGAIIIGSPEYFLPLGFIAVEAGQLVFPGPQDSRRVMRYDLAGDTADYSGRIIPHRM